MRVSQEEKARTHERIVASAARLVRQHGMEATSVNDVMREAKLTHGGFYRHFSGKDDLLGAALDRSFADIFGIVDRELDSGRDLAEVMAEYRKFYLSDDHAAMPGTGCPVAAVGGDVARGSAELKQRFGAGVNRIVERLSGVMKGSAHERKVRAMRQFAMMAGAIMIARASDPDTAKSVLAACRGDS
jgi:TetR/AcrR family transcriptional repressor of nem operon